MPVPDFSQMTRREIEDYLVERAMVEPEFRRELLCSPDRLLRSIGLPIGEEVKIRVLEEEPQSFYLILPRVLPELDDTSEGPEEVGGHNREMVHFFRGYA